MSIFSSEKNWTPVKLFGLNKMRWDVFWCKRQLETTLKPLGDRDCQGLRLVRGLGFIRLHAVELQYPRKQDFGFYLLLIKVFL